MRDVFRTAVERDDYAFLVAKVRERRRVESGYKGEIGELERELAVNGGRGNGGNRRLEEEIERLDAEWKLWE